MSARLYVPLDVNFPDDPKVLEAGPDAELVYLRSLLLAKRLPGDGFIHRAHLSRLAGDLTAVQSAETDEKAIAEALVRSGLWVEVEDGWMIAAWLKHNPSDAEVEASRAAEASRKQEWRKSRRDAERRDEQSRRDTASRDEKSPVPRRDATRRERERESERDREEPPPTPPVEEPGTELAPTTPAVSRGDPVATVFEAWKQSTGHLGAVLDANRRRAIRGALKLGYPLEDLCDAVRGWKHSPHHRGENDRHTIYNDVTLLLRDAGRIEQFRDLERGGRRAPPKVAKAHGALERMARDG